MYAEIGELDLGTAMAAMAVVKSSCHCELAEPVGSSRDGWMGEIDGDDGAPVMAAAPCKLQSSTPPPWKLQTRASSRELL